MTQEEKEILLKDLCARLPYGVKIEKTYVDYPTTLHEDDIVSWKIGEIKIKPYLRPMSSMTEEERRFLLKFGTVGMDENDKVFDVYPYGMERTMSVIDFLNANHFDYRGLIEKGLALEAPEGMYKTE